MSDILKKSAEIQRHSKHPLYVVWQNMVQRCENDNDPCYVNYGGRGIKVCQTWRECPKVFVQWGIDNNWKEGLQIDRIDNDHNYYPANCRFITQDENLRNRQLIQKNNSTGYRGVSYHKRDKVYVASTGSRCKLINIGGYKTAIEAAVERDKYVLKHNLGLPLNF